MGRARSLRSFSKFLEGVEAMTRIIQVSAFTLVAACWLGASGCSSSNDPSTGPSNSASGAPASAAGAGTNPIPPTGGGASGTAAGAGGTTSIAGTSGALGGATGDTGGAPGTAGSGSGDFTPLCAGLLTSAMPPAAPTKGGACTATDPQLCYKTCGPQSTGFKSETCMNGAYVEQSSCSFPPTLDASCYKIPATIDPSCPTTPPQASTVCSVAACTLCNVGGNYLDSTMASKAGYCVCPAPAMAGGTSKWSCASTTAWPCPDGNGC
jgi:hypothetical protein